MASLLSRERLGMPPLHRPKKISKPASKQHPNVATAARRARARLALVLKAIECGGVFSLSTSAQLIIKHPWRLKGVTLCSVEKTVARGYAIRVHNDDGTSFLIRSEKGLDFQDKNKGAEDGYRAPRNR